MYSLRSAVALLALAGTIGACSSAPPAAEPSEQESAAFTRLPGPGPVIPPMLSVRNLCEQYTVPDTILAAMPTWSCPPIAAGTGWMVGTDGRTWFSELMASHPTGAEVARFAPTFTVSMLWGAQPFCVYDYHASTLQCPVDGTASSMNQRYGAKVYQAGATDAGFICAGESRPCPGTGGCPSCKPKLLPPR